MHAHTKPATYPPLATPLSSHPLTYVSNASPIHLPTLSTAVIQKYLLYKNMTNQSEVQNYVTESKNWLMDYILSLSLKNED